MERFQIGLFDKKKKSLPSISCPSWLSCNFPRINLKIFFTACFIPISAVVFDLVYSDTMVIWKLIKYTLEVFNSKNNSSNVNRRNGTTNESIEAAGASLIMMMYIILFIYMVSIAGLLDSPIVSSLKTSYKTSLMLQTEGVDMSTPVGWSQ